ncbi:hypothetical protein QJQ45_025832 [Haematococcus lacustris]|nr:hypothetical protein QJQ45_025832 [Haematococcus lacustris]
MYPWRPAIHQMRHCVRGFSSTSGYALLHEQACLLSTADMALSEGGGCRAPGLQVDGPAPDVEQRKQAMLRQYIEQQMGGSEKAELAQLLQLHGVVVKGGAQQAQELLDALMAWKKGSMGREATGGTNGSSMSGIVKPPAGDNS